jgi:starvation-inducible DNA-binding protein
MSPENPQAIALDGTLVDMLDLSLLAKHAHWNVVGPRFRALHLLLDDLAHLARDGADSIAERAATLGHSPDGRVATILRLSSLPTISPGMLHDDEAIIAFLAILDAAANRIHSALEAFDTDVVTVDLFTGVLAAVEKYAWMLRAHTGR